MAIADLPYLHALGDGGPRSQTQCVVIHATDNTAPASGEASYATRRADRTSAHFYVDGTSAYRALPLGNVAYGCYPMGNSRSVQIELCGRSNAISDATLRQAAPLVAEVCRAYGIPIRKVTPADLVNGVKGICGHIDVTNAWHQGDHTDPGASFPWAAFIGYVQAAATPTPEVPDVNADQDRKLTNVDQYLYAMASGALIIGYIRFPDGTVRELPNVPMQKLAALEDKVGRLEVGGVDLDALAAAVAALLPKPPTAAEVADEIDRRERTRLGNG